MVGKRVRVVVAAFVLVALAGAPGPASANGWEHGAVPYQTLIEALSFESAHIREQAANSVVFRGQPEAVGPLVERLALPALAACLVDEGAAAIRAHCVEAFGDLGSDGALAIVRDHAVDALGTPGAADRIRPLLAADPSADMRMSAARMLGLLHDHGEFRRMHARASNVGAVCRAAH